MKNKTLRPQTIGRLKMLTLGLVAVVFLATPLIQRTLAAVVNVSPTSAVRVTVCGNGILEGASIGGAETCDDGKQCMNSDDCTNDPTVCAGIGDGSCSLRNNDGCNVSCLVEAAGSRPLPTIISISQITVRPEQRSLANGNNYDTDFYLTVLNADNLNRQIRYQSNSPVSANTSGIAYPYLTMDSSVTPGVYDVMIKPKAHLAKLLNNVYLQAGDNSLNFTNLDNGSTIGSEVLVAGDLDGSGTSLFSAGDNVINSVDLSVLLSQLNAYDPGGNGNRSNLNQDSVVDQSDLNILLNNLDKEGDR